MMKLQLIKSSVIPNSSPNLTSVVREASCSRGWLRIVVQYIFGAVTVASFILIVLMSMQTSRPNRRQDLTRCYQQNCRIVCNSTTGNYEEEINYIVAEAELICSKITLAVLNFVFENETMPRNWLSTIRNIQRLVIFRGNLKYITPNAFMSMFGGGLKVIFLQEVTIADWRADTFVGLTDLRELYVTNCTIVDIERNALRVVDDTLEILTITHSNKWNPLNLTGRSSLRKINTVDLSFNTFNNVLRRKTFTGLNHCKILYLNSCNITALEAGTFDSLNEIEVIYLNNNKLVTIPTGLFDYLIYNVDPIPRVNLQHNLWHCDCANNYFTKLYNSDILYVDPTCTSPKELQGKPFSAIEEHCIDKSYANIVVVDIVDLEKTKIYNSSEMPHKNMKRMRCGNIPIHNSSINNNNSSLRLITPNEDYSCNVNVTHVNNFDQNLPPISGHRKNDWIKPSFLIKNDNYSTVQIGSLISNDYGLIWYESTCPSDIYCISTLPKLLRIYDLDFISKYTFCPIEIKSSLVMFDKCVEYDFLSENVKIDLYNYGLKVYIFIGIICLIVGAILVYSVIRYNPILLKGSKRLLFVKHKNVDALVLPPKVPLRNNLSNGNSNTSIGCQKICVITENQDRWGQNNFIKVKSTGSDSSSVSYISALEPTDAELAEWRVRRHIDSSLTITSMTSEFSIFSWIHDDGNPNIRTDINHDNLK